VANDEDDDDEDQHFSDGVIATLVRRNRVVTLRRAADLAEDQAVQHNLNIKSNQNNFILFILCLVVLIVPLFII
jgi:hypothetical protein